MVPGNPTEPDLTEARRDAGGQAQRDTAAGGGSDSGRAYGRASEQHERKGDTAMCDSLEHDKHITKGEAGRCARDGTIGGDGDA